MLKELRIRNFVLIEDLELRFEAGICLLTGETGAGKSILIDAVEAAIGHRVSLDVIRQGAPKATVEATFELPGGFSPGLAAALAEAGLEPDVEGELTLAREISPRGARCRIDGQQVTQQVLRQIGSHLVDVLSQHEHQALMEPSFHLRLLDTAAGLQGLRQALGESHQRWFALASERRRLRENARARAKERDFWAFQLAEIEKAALTDPEEDDKLKAERLALTSVTELRETGLAAYEGLYGGEPSLYDSLSGVIGRLRAQGGLDPVFAEAAVALTDAAEILKDQASAVRARVDRLEADPERLASIEARLDQLSALARKYGPGLPAVMAYASELERHLGDSAEADARLSELDGEIEGAAAKARALAAELTAGRRKAADELSAAVETQLKELELPSARFEVALLPYEQRASEPASVPAAEAAQLKAPQPDGGVRYVRASGAEAAEFRIAMNPGEPPKPLAKTASGGEMARVMLALKSVLAGSSEIPTLIFDEVDTGISGKAAQAVAEKLGALGSRVQVLCITHLPTVAAMADQHLHLEKRVAEGRTRVFATVLDEAGRVLELAHLASGGATPEARSHAEALLKRARELKARPAVAAGH